MDRSGRARDVDHEHAEQVVGQALVLVEQLDVEEVPWVAAVECRVELPAIQVLEGHDIGLEEPEAFGHRFGRRHRPRWIDGAARDRGGSIFTCA